MFKIIALIAGTQAIHLKDAEKELSQLTDGLEGMSRSIQESTCGDHCMEDDQIPDAMATLAQTTNAKFLANAPKGKTIR